MSSLVTVGFFNLSGGQRSASIKPNSSTTTWHSYYHTTVQCDRGSILQAQVRIYSPVSDVPLPDGTIAFILGKVCVQAQGPVLIDAITLAAVPGDPLLESYQNNAPDVLHPVFFVLGSVAGKPEAQDDGGRKVGVMCSEFVRDGRKNSTIQCLFAAGARWANTPMPSPNTVVYALGTAYDTGPEGSLTISVLHFVLNVCSGANNNAGGPRNDPPSGPHKRQRFAGWSSASHAPASSGTTSIGNAQASTSGSAKVTVGPPLSGSSAQTPVTSHPPDMQDSIATHATHSAAPPPVMQPPESEMSISTSSTLTPMGSDVSGVDEVFPSNGTIPNARRSKAKGKRPARK